MAYAVASAASLYYGCIPATPQQDATLKRDRSQ
jgi:hypothetical protein